VDYGGKFGELQRNGIGGEWSRRLGDWFGPSSTLELAIRAALRQRRGETSWQARVHHGDDNDAVACSDGRQGFEHAREQHDLAKPLPTSRSKTLSGRYPHRMDQARPRRVALQIGRASCRERESRTGVAGGRDIAKEEAA